CGLFAPTWPTVPTARTPREASDKDRAAQRAGNSADHCGIRVGMAGGRHWGWLLGLGIILIVLGIVAVSDVVLTTLASMLVIGWLLAIGGAVQVVHAFRTRGWTGMLAQAMAGILYLVAGLLLLTHPLAGAVALTLVAAFFLYLVGLLRISAVAALRWAGWGWTLTAGIIDLGLATLVVMHWPATALWVIGLFVAIEMLIGGISLLMLGVAQRMPDAGIAPARMHRPAA
ncbi:MAG: HdeD family acid-resistance protein, partial [Terriglobales bacterium]